MGELLDKTGHITFLNRTLSRTDDVNINLHIISKIIYCATEIQNIL